jgi:hypothetical protein
MPLRDVLRGVRWAECRVTAIGDVVQQQQLLIYLTVYTGQVRHVPSAILPVSGIQGIIPRAFSIFKDLWDALSLTLHFQTSGYLGTEA